MSRLGRAARALKKTRTSLGARKPRSARSRAKTPAKRRNIRSVPTRDGFVASLVISERSGTLNETIARWWTSGPSWEAVVGQSRHGKIPAAGLRLRRTRFSPPGVWRAWNALGHAQRLRILQRLLDGPATYQAVRRATGLKVGPLYHHINHLRLAGLIRPKQRDLYELTRGGRNLTLGAILLGSLARDRRQRPLG